MGLNVGKMRHRIEIQSLQMVENEVGEQVKQWTTVKKLWSEKKQLKGTNPVSLGKEGIEYTYRFKIRYTTSITEDMRVVYKGVIYDIDHVNNIRELEAYTTIDCTVHKEGVYNE